MNSSQTDNENSTKLEKYDPSTIEPKWQSKWQSEKTYQPELAVAKNDNSEANSEKPFYNLMMFPYPSAEGLHVGNMYAFTGADAFGRFKRQQGYSVFEPIGLDGFGIHSENYALKVGTHPMDQAEKSEKNFYRQLHTIGNSYDWSHTVETYKPDYYIWTQWFFIELFKAGLAYREKSPVNFCPSCKTVLADEQVEDGKCERCNSVVEKRDLEQWFFKITDYAEQLLQGLDQINWTEKVKVAQRNWIGKSTGAKISFSIVGRDESLEVFTTRPDTLHGATFMVISPEHPLVEKWLANDGVKVYVEKAKAKSDEERRENKEKSGVFSGDYALNPVNNKQIPIWIADYVLMGYGTGAIMAVPAHDERDFAFARQYNLPIIPVVEGGTGEEAYVAKGKLVNSGEWNGWQMPEESDKVLTYLEDKQIGVRHVQYHLRDWLISRQRYWGPPIPMIYCEHCASNGKGWLSENGQSVSGWNADGWYPAEDLPVSLPKIDDYKPLGTGKAPLASHPEFYETTCPSCGGQARRETDVSDTFLDSSWYFLRYLATDWETVPFPSEKFVSEFREADSRTQWLPVSSYIGGAEHSVLHLLYTRFFYKVLVDRGYIDPAKGDEPFPTFFAHGLIIKDGAKMSKSKGNVVVPDEYIAKYGADALRTYLMFLGPFSQGGDFRDSGIEGMFRFMKRVWKFTVAAMEHLSEITDSESLSLMHQTVKDVTEDMENLRYNTAIAKIMTYYNYLHKQKNVTKQQVEVLLKVLAPFAPHMTEELYQRLYPTANGFESIHTQPWPAYQENSIEQGEVVIAIQVNGKLRDTLQLESEQSPVQEEIERAAKERENVARHLEGKSIRKVIYVPGKILNFVVS